MYGLLVILVLGKGNIVKGEVYEVDDKVLSDLDELEEHPNFYTREKYNVKCTNADSSDLNVWIYFIKRFKPELLNSTMLENYSSKGPHGLGYVARYERNITGYNFRVDVLPGL